MSTRPSLAAAEAAHCGDLVHRTDRQARNGVLAAIHTTR